MHRFSENLVCFFIIQTTKMYLYFTFITNMSFIVFVALNITLIKSTDYTKIIKWHVICN